MLNWTRAAYLRKGDVFVIQGEYVRHPWYMRLYRWWMGIEGAELQTYVVTDTVVSDAYIPYRPC